MEETVVQQSNHGDSELLEFTDAEQQLIADIIFTFVVQKTPQGIVDAESVMKYCLPDIMKDVPTLEEKHHELIYDLIRQIAVPIDGYDRDDRLFPVELENQTTTDLRNKIV